MKAGVVKISYATSEVSSVYNEDFTEKLDHPL
jgi:hypothetical protein